MSHKIENAIISELSWTRDSDGHWKFSQYCDDIVRIWNNERTRNGYVKMVSHAINTKTMEIKTLPPVPLDSIGARYDSELCEWVI